VDNELETVCAEILIAQLENSSSPCLAECPMTAEFSQAGGV